MLVYLRVYPGISYRYARYTRYKWHWCKDFKAIFQRIGFRWKFCDPNGELSIVHVDSAPFFGSLNPFPIKSRTPIPSKMHLGGLFEKSKASEPSFPVCEQSKH